MSTSTELPQATCAHDPYRSYRFRLKCDDRYVAGISKVSALARPPGSPRRMPGQDEYPPVTLFQGTTRDPAFARWTKDVWDYRRSTTDDAQGGNQDVSLKDVRKDLILEVYNEAGQKIAAYSISRCWPSEFDGVPDLTGNGVAISLLKLENKGFQRDDTIIEPAETL